jgi:hypothetical protein
LDGDKDDIDGDEAAEAEENEVTVVVEDCGGVAAAAVMWPLSLNLLAAAAATLWMDLGDKVVFLSGKWGWKFDTIEEVGKLRLTELPLRHKRAAS